jgi:hypothetical protein
MKSLNENYLTNHMSKFVGFGCDGASNMMGCKTGLVTRLQECYPEVEDIGNDREVKIDSFVSCCLLCQCPFLYTSFLMPWSDTILI